jgi:hypothetical protein
MASMIKSETDDVYRTQASTMACDELMANVRADDDEVFKLTAGMGMEGLLRPFSTLTTEPADEVDGEPPASAMSHFETPSYTPPSARKSFNSQDMDPFKDSDVDLIVSGDEYADNLHRKKGDVDGDNIRALALRGPLVVQGWSVEMTGKPVPNSADESGDVQDWEDDWLADHKKHPEKWKTGVVELAWDKWAKVWAQPTHLWGKALEDIGPGQTGRMLIETQGGIFGPDEVDVENWLQGDITTNMLMVATYHRYSSTYRVTAAQCPS